MKNTLKLMTLGIALFGSVVVAESVFADVTKEEGSTELIVTDPQVTVTKAEEDSIWSDVNVEIKTDIPDNVEINENDTMTFNVPNELTFETNYQFPVYNSTGETEVGEALVDSGLNTVITTFNNYFQEHPLDKSISLNLNTKINRNVVTENEVKKISFNGTIVDLKVGSKGTIDPNEQLYKYGYQDKNDPTVINWVARINYKKDHLVDLNISDTWSDDQEYIEGSLIYSHVNNVDPWDYDTVGTYELGNTKFHKNGFSTYAPQLKNKILMVEYKTRMKQMVYNPTNSITVSWKGGSITHEVETRLVGGNGKAEGKSRPKWDKPNEAPVHDKPEFEGGVVPLDPPVHTKPEWYGGTVPFDAPKYEKPEWQGGVIPNDAPVHNKPFIDLKDIPQMPPAPVLELPELKIPDVPAPKEEKPKTEVPTPDQPGNKVQETTYVTKGQQLPATGEDFSIAITGIGMFLLGAVVGAVNTKKYLEDK